MTVSDTRASATLGVQLGVRIRGVAYDDLHQVRNMHDNGPCLLQYAQLQFTHAMLPCGFPEPKDRF